MAKTKKEGKESAVAVKLQKEQAETDKAQAAREDEMKALEAEKAQAAKEASDDQTPPIAVRPDVAGKEREAAWKKHIENYSKANPVKYAQKKARGEFDKIPADFNGADVLKSLKLQEMPGK